MARLNYRVKDGSNPQGKPRVYMIFHPEDFFPLFKKVSDDIFQTQNCAIYYNTDWNIPWSNEDAELYLGQMNLFVFLVTDKFLDQLKTSGSFELSFAIKHSNSIPVLPIMCEKGLEKKANEVFDNIQLLDRTDQTDSTVIPYKYKLERILSSVLTSEKMLTEIKHEFNAHIFLSYRKKDRKLAQELIRQIHQLSQCRDIAIWYDEFLVPGEKFNKGIQEQLDKSDLVTFVITPRIIEKDNYVVTHEYPQAKKSNKPILPVEMHPTDRKLLYSSFPEIPEPVDAHDKGSLLNKLQAALSCLAGGESRNTNDPKHLYYIGMAYLQGIDVERNCDLGFDLISKASEMGFAEAQFYLGQYLAHSGQDTDEIQERIVKLYSLAAEQGHPEAQYCLANCYYRGQGVAQDFVTALMWQERAANQGVADAQYDLGEYCYSGILLLQNYEKAVAWWKKAACQNNENAQRRLGDCYAEGKGVEQNYKKAVEWWIQAAEKDDSAGLAYRIGLSHYHGRGVEPDHEEAEKWFRKTASQFLSENDDNDGYDFFQHFEYNEQGESLYNMILEACTQDIMKHAQSDLPYMTFTWYKGYNTILSYFIKRDSEAAMQGNADAQLNLGLCFANMEKEEKQNLKRAVYWFRKAADQGVADAQYYLGRFCSEGRGMEKNSENAVYWYQKAATQGHVDAQSHLGECYYYGEGITQDYDKAAEWSKKAAEHGNSAAQYVLGLLYAEGKGVDQDYERAVEWWKEADVKRFSDCTYLNAEEKLCDYYMNLDTEEGDEKAAECCIDLAFAGNSLDAEYLLGCFYAEGKGVDEDPVQAVDCLFHAAWNGHADAEKKLEDICNPSPEDLKLRSPFLASAMNYLADLIKHSNDEEMEEETEILYRRALEIRRKLAEDDPDTYQNDLYTSCYNLAAFLEGFSDRVSRMEAEELYREALEILRRLNDNTSAYKENLSDCCKKLARLLEHHSDMESRKEAEQLYHEAYEIDEDLAEAHNDPTDEILEMLKNGDLDDITIKGV